MFDGIPCMWMRGGTSKGAYFLASDLPTAPAARDEVLLSILGSPDPRQIDGIGGGDPLSSKVAIVAPSKHPGIDVDYLFLQVFVDENRVSDAQNCGNILAGVGPFAIERGLVEARLDETPVRIFMQNTGQIAIAHVSTPNGHVTYSGDARIDGVPGTSAAIPITFQDTAGSSCGALFPSGQPKDTIDGIDVTMIDNGMPCALMRATDLGLLGTETPSDLEANATLRARIEAIRLIAGTRMNLSDVAGKTVPKMTIISPPTKGGAINTRTFIPHSCHQAIGVLGAVSIATACLTKGTVADGIAVCGPSETSNLSIEHPSGEMTIIGHIKDGQVVGADVLRTARKLMDGLVFASSAP
ncbi:MAG: 4-oxalomesaconate tautomerase [Loktanella sp.]|nr:4-oxalomesaconate tautomerase [Loktanella sp.]MDO7627504.1 4-oxalomesaconate tautomerase [Loktanella sp.]MDO7664026.1 4-oxalomesaconate tautomerase [Loktanella sp.]MDO7723260.1 4-oxalomesaconate tautomerase [Loktanella sp.]